MRISLSLPLAWLVCTLGIFAPGQARGSEAPAAPTAPIKLEVGGITLLVPAPAGFERADGISPKWDTTVNSTVAASNRLLAFFMPTQDVAKLRAGSFPKLQRSLNIQILKSLETKHIDEKAFSQTRDEIRKGVDSAKAQVDAQLKQLAEKGNATLQNQLGVDAALKFGNTAVLGYFDDSPDSLGFTMAMKYQVQGAANEAPKSVVAAMVAPFNDRLFYLYANANYSGEADRQWAEKSVSAWRDAIRAANDSSPKLASADPPVSLEQHTNASSIVPSKSPIVWAIVAIGILLAAAMFLIVRNRKPS